MQPLWLIIDGYNVLHQVDELAELLQSDIQMARHRLIRMVENAALDMAPQTTIVFDGREAGADPAMTSKHLEIFFSPSNLSADSIIERLVCKCHTPEKIRVVTSDRAERDTVSSAGAQTMSSEDFITYCGAHAKRPLIKKTPPGQKPRLGDLFPDGW